MDDDKDSNRARVMNETTAEIECLRERWTTRAKAEAEADKNAQPPWETAEKK